MRRILGILAGGRSSRFRTAKSHLHIDGEPIVTWLQRRLGPAVDECWLNLGPQQDLPPGSERCRRIVRDPEPFAGPTTGILALLDATEPGDLMAITAVDMPLLESGDVRRLLDTLEADRQALAVMSRWLDGPRGGEVEPLPSGWRGSAAAAAIRQADRRGPSALAELTWVHCLGLKHDADAGRWHSVNRPDDLETLRALGHQVESNASGPSSDGTEPRASAGG